MILFIILPPVRSFKSSLKTFLSFQKHFLQTHCPEIQYVCVCARVHVCVCVVCVCAHACVRVCCVCVHAHACACACVVYALNLENMYI